MPPIIINHHPSKMDAGTDIMLPELPDALSALPGPGAAQQRDVDSSMNILFKEIETAMMNGDTSRAQELLDEVKSSLSVSLANNG